MRELVLSIQEAKDIGGSTSSPLPWRCHMIHLGYSHGNADAFDWGCGHMQLSMRLRSTGDEDARDWGYVQRNSCVPEGSQKLCRCGQVATLSIITLAFSTALPSPKVAHSGTAGCEMAASTAAF